MNGTGELDLPGRQIAVGIVAELLALWNQSRC